MLLSGISCVRKYSSQVTPMSDLPARFYEIWYGSDVLLWVGVLERFLRGKLGVS
jgi:hypothetical protein